MIFQIPIISFLYLRHATCARALGDWKGEGSALGNLGEAYTALNDVRKAIVKYYEQQLDIMRRIGDRRGEEAALGNLGKAYADFARLYPLNLALGCVAQGIMRARNFYRLVLDTNFPFIRLIKAYLLYQLADLLRPNPGLYVNLF